jgi:hypothetical protein
VTSGLDADAIGVEMSDGVLTLHLPKPAQPQPRRIEIRPGSTTGNGSASQPAEQASAGEPQSEGSASQQPAAAQTAGAPQSEGAPSGAVA